MVKVETLAKIVILFGQIKQMRYNKYWFREKR